MKAIRAKFVCESVTELTHQKQIKMYAVYSDTEENKDFTEASPDGQLSISIMKEMPASDFFKPGKEYYLDFTEAPVPEIKS